MSAGNDGKEAGESEKVGPLSPSRGTNRSASRCTFNAGDGVVNVGDDGSAGACLIHGIHMMCPYDAGTTPLTVYYRNKAALLLSLFQAMSMMCRQQCSSHTEKSPLLGLQFIDSSPLLPRQQQQQLLPTTTRTSSSQLKTRQQEQMQNERRQLLYLAFLLAALLLAAPIVCIIKESADRLFGSSNSSSSSSRDDRVDESFNEMDLLLTNYENTSPLS